MWRRWFIVPMAAFVASRLLTVAAAFAARYPDPTTDGILDILTGRWDSLWYLLVASDGYPSFVPEGHGDAAQSSLGFFPLYPLVTRALSEVLRVDLAVVAIALTLVAGAVATLLVWQLAEGTFGKATADRSAFLFCFFPGAYALSLAYTEALFIAFAAGCLLLLGRRKWWWAALVGGIGSAARPTGYVLALCCAFAVIMHWRRTREWKPLLSPILAAGGFLAHMGYLWVRTGDAFAYQHAQERGWGQRIDFGATTAKRVIESLLPPTNDLNLLVPSLAVVAAVPLVWLLVRVKPPGTWVVFTVAAFVPGLMTAAIATTPRHLLVAFPVLIGAGQELRENVYACTLALFAGGLMLLMLLIGGTTLLTP